MYTYNNETIDISMYRERDVSMYIRYYTSLSLSLSLPGCLRPRTAFEHPRRGMAWSGPTDRSMCVYIYIYMYIYVYIYIYI